jgi:hypothetical protein
MIWLQPVWLQLLLFSVLEDKFKKEKELSELESFGTIFLICSFLTWRVDAYLHSTFSPISRNDLGIEKYTQDCTFFKFYLACYNFFASYTCVIVFFIILCTTKKNEKTQHYLYREGGKEWWGMYSIIRQARRKRSLFLKHSFFLYLFFISSLFCFSLYDYLWIVAYYVCIWQL